MTLNDAANISAILTAIVAVIGYGIYKCEYCKKSRALEEYLKSEKEIGKKTATNNGQRSIMHLMANVGLTEAEILQISFKNKKIKRITTKNLETGLAANMLLEYVEDNE